MSSSDTRFPPSESDGSAGDTKQRLLAAAERLFAEHGFEGTSLRAVAREARTSVSAANYHFGSKEALLRRALVRRLGPLNSHRVAGLDSLEAAANGAPAAVEAVLEAFFRPGFEADRQTDDGRAAFRNIAAQLYTSSHETMISLKAEIFEPMFDRFIDALARSLPDRSRDELALDFRFLIGVMIHALSGHTRNEEEGGGVPAVSDEHLLRRMVCFTSAGLRAKSAVAVESAHDGEPA